jgi:hypothetical protein
LAIVFAQSMDDFDPNRHLVDFDPNPEGTAQMLGFPPKRPWERMKPRRLMACLGLLMLPIVAWGQATAGTASTTPAKTPAKMAAKTSTTTATVSRVTPTAMPAMLPAVPDEPLKGSLPQAMPTSAPAPAAVIRQNAQAGTQYAEVQSFAEARERMRRAFIAQDYQSVLTLSRQVEQKYEVDQSGDFYVTVAKMRLDEKKAHQKGQSAYPYPSISDFVPKQVASGSMPSVDPDFNLPDMATPAPTPLAVAFRPGGATPSLPAPSTRTNPTVTQAKPGEGRLLPAQSSKIASTQANVESASPKQLALVVAQRPVQASAVASSQAPSPLASINPTEQIYIGLVVVALLILGLIFLFVLRRREQPEEDLAKTLSELAGEPVTVTEGPASVLDGSGEKARAADAGAGAPTLRSSAPTQASPALGADLDEPIVSQPTATKESADVSGLFEEETVKAASTVEAKTQPSDSGSTTLDDILWEETVADEKQNAHGEGKAQRKDETESGFDDVPLVTAPATQSTPTKASDELYEELFGKQPLPESKPKPDKPSEQEAPGAFSALPSIDLESLPLADHRVGPNPSANDAIVLDGIDEDSAPKSEETGSEEAGDSSPKTDQKTKDSTEFTDLPEITQEQENENLNDTLANVDETTLPGVDEATVSSDPDDMTLPSISDQPTQPSRESVMDGEASDTIESSEFAFEPNDALEPGADANADPDAASEDLFDREKREGEACLQHQDWNGAVHHLSVASALRPDQADIKEMLREARRQRRVHGAH